MEFSETKLIPITKKRTFFSLIIFFGGNISQFGFNYWQENLLFLVVLIGPYYRVLPWRHAHRSSASLSLSLSCRRRLNNWPKRVSSVGPEAKSLPQSFKSQQKSRPESCLLLCDDNVIMKFVSSFGAVWEANMILVDLSHNSLTERQGAHLLGIDWLS